MIPNYIKEFQPPSRILMGPGPSNVHPRVLQAMTAPILGHLDSQFFEVMEDVCDMLRQVYHTDNYMTLPLSSTGTGAMEASCVNLLEPGDTAIICRNGYFGDRLADIAKRCGAEVFVVDSSWGNPVDIEALDEELNKHPKVKMVGMVHAETSTGSLSPLTRAIEMTHEHDALIVVDAVTSLGSHDVRMDEWDIDVCYSASQKCLGAPPGLAPISLGSRAMAVINERRTPVQSFYFNLKDLQAYWSETHAYHHTSPISMTYALRESLRMMMEEGINERLKRHARTSAALRAGVEALGLEVLADPQYRLNPLTAALIPAGVDEAVVRRKLINDYNIEIGAGLGDLKGKVWRIGLMGESARESNVFAFLSALERILPDQGYEVAYGSSLAAAQQALADFGD
ncbi:MAG: alanine--glyoxylate aminotransferase family protein [Chloroflexota bacterium]|nr:alanine--glyoxylate aminotransferase family protein [Chloroflexota bacterium]